MTRALMSIKPEFVDGILSGEKKFEYRKNRCSRSIDRIVIYSSSPVKKIVAEVEIKGVLSGTPEEIWSQTQEGSGTSKLFFSDYYKGHSVAYAYVLGKVTKFKTGRTLSYYGVKKAPQSFVYVDIKSRHKV